MSIKNGTEDDNQEVYPPPMAQYIYPVNIY